MEANTILTFRDEHGQEWLAAAVVGPLTRSVQGGPDLTLNIEDLKDRAFGLLRFTVIDREPQSDTEEADRGE